MFSVQDTFLRGSTYFGLILYFGIFAKFQLSSHNLTLYSRTHFFISATWPSMLQEHARTHSRTQSYEWRKEVVQIAFFKNHEKFLCASLCVCVCACLRRQIGPIEKIPIVPESRLSVSQLSCFVHQVKCACRIFSVLKWYTQMLTQQ